MSWTLTTTFRLCIVRVEAVTWPSRHHDNFAREVHELTLLQQRKVAPLLQTGKPVPLHNLTFRPFASIEMHHVEVVAVFCVSRFINGICGVSIEDPEQKG
ncbi:hypothetical protein BC938DRAFT_474350 [Jimgerdemannia flammicorona]|uniref:Uncharacterized protein n=1 Tax=Jimgerdemannia flammicorona TaxID=994334 RepID=A0A433Q2J8_9FUNG|nr:hypothetical protein BC938DRAFT_474350 [Jimgerdemannia flammicorona]